MILTVSHFSFDLWWQHRQLAVNQPIYQHGVAEIAGQDTMLIFGCNGGVAREMAPLVGWHTTLCPEISKQVLEDYFIDLLIHHLVCKMSNNSEKRHYIKTKGGEKSSQNLKIFCSLRH